MVHHKNKSKEKVRGSNFQTYTVVLVNVFFFPFKYTLFFYKTKTFFYNVWIVDYSLIRKINVF